MHYCMGRLVDLSITVDDSERCPECGMDKEDEEQKGCCKDEHQEIKVKDHHKASLFLWDGTQFIGTLTTTFYDLPDVFAPSVEHEHPLSHAPPRHGKIDFYILNRSFRI